MKTVKHLPSNPTVVELMEVAYNEGLEGNILMSPELERRIDDTLPSTENLQRINDAHANGWADYRDAL